MTSLEKKHKNILNKNEADSYVTYVSKNGVSRKNKYQAALEDAATKRKLSDTNYGALADRLSDSGLNASGYEDYLASKSNSRYNSSVGAAREKLLIDEYTERSGYASYLSDYERIQSKLSESLIKKISGENNLNLDSAYSEVVNAGLSKSLAYATASAAVEKAKENVTVKAINFAKKNYLSASDAQKYALKLGLDDNSAKIVYNAISALSDDDKDYYSGMSAKEYYSYVKSKAKK